MNNELNGLPPVTMKIYYVDGEIDVLEDIPIDMYTVEMLTSPFGTVAIEDLESGKQYLFNLDHIKKIEFLEGENDAY